MDGFKKFVTEYKGAIIGAIIGAFIATSLDAVFLKKIFSVFVFCVGVYELFKR